MRVLITGASSGIGEASAVRLSASHELILCGRDKGRLENVRNACSDPQKHRVFAFDLSDVESLDAVLSDYIQAEYLKIDAFAHCAGCDSYMQARSFDIKTVNEMMSVNVYSAMAIVKCLLKKKPNEKALANIVFVSSVASRKGSPGKSFYAASKGALNSYMRSLAVELAPAVRVNCVLPGAVRTPLTAGLLANPEIAGKLEREHPLGIGNAADIAAAIEFLLSDAASWISGVELPVDGGYSA